MIHRIVTLCAICAASTAQAALVLDGPGDSTPLHVGPDVHYHANDTAADGTVVETLDKTLTWTFVRLPDGRLGWVQTAHLVPEGSFEADPAPEIETSVLPPPRPDLEQAAAEPVPDEAAAETPEPSDTPNALEIIPVDAYSSVVWPDAGKLNLRAGPGLGFDVLAQMERGDWVSVSAKAGPWRKVEHESGQKGWAHEAYLTN